jgi:predicted transcriptional regulator
MAHPPAEQRRPGPCRPGPRRPLALHAGLLASTACALGDTLRVALVSTMTAVKALVKNGRLTLDEPTDLPEGTVVPLDVADDWDDLDDEERAALHESIREGFEDAKAGRTIDAEQWTRVENGRIKLDEPTNLPNGTELYLVPAGQIEDVVLLDDDGLDDDERQELLQAIDESLAEADAGKVEDLSKLIAKMRE